MKKIHVDILKGVNFTFDKKKIYVITGPNGGGKSSLARVVMGIYKPTGGYLPLDGQDITNLDKKQGPCAMRLDHNAKCYGYIHSGNICSSSGCTIDT